MNNLIYYPLGKFIDTNHTKPAELIITKEAYLEMCHVIDEKVTELGYFSPEKTGETDIMLLMMALTVEEQLLQFASKAKNLQINQSFKIIIPMHLSIFLANFLSDPNKNYGTDTRIARGSLDTIISQNKFSESFSSTYQMPTTIQPFTHEVDMSNVKSISSLTPKFQIQ